jgi:hypothetical protein
MSYWFQTRWFLCEFPIGSYVKLSTAVQPSWSEGGTPRHNFGRGPSNDYFIKAWFQLSNRFLTRRFLCEFPIGSYDKLSTAVQPSWSEGGTTRHNFGRGPSNDYFIKAWFQLSNRFQTRRFLCEFPIGSYVKLSSAVEAILVQGPNCLTNFWKRTIQWLFHQHLVLIEQMVSNKKIVMGISHRVLC